MKTIENHRTNRSELADFHLEIFSFNRDLSGFEPLIEKCSMKIRIDRSEHSRSIRICSDEVGKSIENQFSHIIEEKTRREIRRIDSFCLQNQLNEHRNRNSSSNLYRCDTFDQSVIIAKQIEHAQQMFHEEAFIYCPNDQQEN